MMMPVRRDLHFELPTGQALTEWHPAGYHVSMFINTLSLLFPIGERFFIDAVRSHRDQVNDPELQQAITAFIGQEAMHGREHQELNDLLKAQGYPVEDIERFVFRLLKWVENRYFGSRRFREAGPLNGTIALEHFTAILADALLSDPELLGDSEPAVKAMLQWHAMEETEHKAVAFDVWERVMGRGPRAYLYRVLGQVTATLTLAGVMAWAYTRMLRAAPEKRKDAGSRRRLRRFAFGRSGPFRRIIPNYLDYFRPGFHPWDHDNRHLLAGMDRFQEQQPEVALPSPDPAHGSIAAATPA